MPPPITPSPHRFVVKQQPPQNWKTPLTQEYKPPRPPPPPIGSTPRPPPSSSSQFAVTPRFHLPSTPRPTATPRHILTTPKLQLGYAEPTPSASRYLAPAKKVEREEDAINSSYEEDVHDSIEHNGDGEESYEFADLEDDFDIEIRSPKRRRLSSSPLPTNPTNIGHHSEPSSSFSLPNLSSPPETAPKRAIPASASRFITPAPPSTQQSTDITPGQTTFRKPPPFRPPSPSSTQAYGDPLPEQFSPHGKVRKYIPGGLATELQGWLFNVESTSHTSRFKDEEWVVMLVVDDVSGDQRSGITMISGRQIHGISEGREDVVDSLGEVRVILAGGGQITGLQRSNIVERGNIIGIKGPVWEVLAGEGKWGVGCDWKVLEGTGYV